MNRVMSASDLFYHHAVSIILDDHSDLNVKCEALDGGFPDMYGSGPAVESGGKVTYYSFRVCWWSVRKSPCNM